MSTSNSEPLPTETHKHTPAPWTLKRDVNREEYSIIVPPKIPGAVGYQQIASLDFGFDEPFESQQHANAHLIAAAPDLYATLNDVLDSFDRQTMEEMLRKDNDAHDDDEFCVNLTAKQLRAINQAILKAEGKA